MLSVISIVSFKQMKRFIFILFLIGSQSGIAQTHQWAQFYRSVYGSASSIGTDSKGNVFMVGNIADSLFIDSQIISNGISQKRPNIYFCKLTPTGKLSWCKVINIYGSIVAPNHVQIVSDNKVVIYGMFYGSKLKFTANDSLTDLTYTALSSINNGFVALYDSSGKFISANKTYIGHNFGTYPYGWSYNHNFHIGAFSMDSKGCFYLKFHKDSTIGTINYKGGSIALNDTIAKDIIVKYSPGFDTILWYKEFPKTESFHVTRIRAGADDNLYLACHVGGANFTLDGKAYRYQNYTNKSFLSILSPKGTFIHNSLINVDSTQQDIIWDIGAKDTNTIYIIGYVEDSINYKNKWYTSSNKKASKATINNAFPYFGNIGLSKGAQWVRLPNTRSYQAILNPHKIGYTSMRLAFDKSGHIYASFNTTDSLISIGGLSAMVSVFKRQVFVKFYKWEMHFGLKLFLRQ